MKNKALSPEVSKQHCSNDFMSFFSYKIDNIRDKIINYTTVYYSITSRSALSSHWRKVWFIHCYKRMNLLNLLN